MTDPTQLTETEREAIRGAIASGYYDHTADDRVCAAVARIKADAIADTKRALLADSRTRVEWETRTWLTTSEGKHELTISATSEAEAVAESKATDGTAWRREVTSIYGEWEQVEI